MMVGGPDVRDRADVQVEPGAPGRLQQGALVRIYMLVGLLATGLVTFVVTFLLTSHADTLGRESRDLARWAAMLSESTQRVLFDTDLLAAALEEELATSGWRTPEDFRRAASGREMYEWMRGAVLISSSADAVSLIDANGALLNNSRSYPPPPLNFADREYLRVFRERPEVSFQIVGPLKNRVTSLDSIFLVRRVLGRGGEFIGTINANIHAARMRRIIERTLADQPVAALLLRRDGQVMLHHPSADAANPLDAPVLQFLRETLSRGDSGTLYLSGAAAGGAPRLLAVQALPGYPLVIAVSKPQDAVLASWRQQAQLMALLTAGAVLLVMGLGWMLARQWRLRTLAVESEQLRSLNAQLKARVVEREQAEVALRKLNDELELRVDQRTEQLRAALADAERASRAKSEFLSGMSHELRTPLNAVLGFAQLLEADKSPRLNERQLGFVDHIHRSGKHLLSLINEVLDLARVEAGRLTVNLEPVALAPLIAECIALVKPEADARRLRLDVVPPPADWHAQADRTRARQVLLNLLSNAIKYNRPQGAVSVRVERDPSHLRLTVEDTGRGLDAEQLARLFVPFERAGADGGGTEGTGIGLALSKRLMELMHGQIGVRSAPGVGSLFWVEWPVAASVAADGADTSQDTPTADNAATADAKGDSYRVLCIEDNAVNRLFIEQVVARHRGVRLHCAEHPQRGLELARELHPDLILLDINLPEMDGYAVFERLRADESTRAIPVVAISARAMPADVARGHAVGFAAYLTKPLDLEQFDQVLAEQMALRRARDA